MSALAIRLDVQKTLEGIAALEIESQVRQEIGTLNERIREASFAVTWGPSVNVLPLDADEVASQRQARRLDEGATP